MTIEAYRIAATMGLNIDPTIAGLNETIAAFRRVLEVQKSVVEMQRNLTASIRASATAARDFADQMERAARAGQNMASAAASTGGAAASAVAAAAATGRSSGPLLLPAPQRGFTLSGAPYGAGTSLVPVGGVNTLTEATGARPPDAAAIAAYRAAGGMGYGNAAMGGGGGGPAGPLGPYTGGIPLNAPPGGWPNQQRGPFPTSDLLKGAYGAQRIGAASSGFIGDMFTEGATEKALEQRLARQGFTPEQVQAAYAAAVKAQQDSLGTYVNENMKTVLMLMGLTQSASASLAEMPLAARASAVLSGLGRSGPEELNAVLRSAELRGVLMKEGSSTVDIGALNHFIRMTEDITALSGGTKGPSDLLQFMISSKAAGAMLDEKTLPGMLALIQALGPARAGTQLVGFSQQFSSGKMSDGSFKFLTEGGVIKDPELARKVAIAYHQLLPGAMGPDDLREARGNPAGFIMHRILPNVRSYLEKNYGAAYTQGDETQKQQYEQATSQMWGSTIQGGGFMAEIIRLAPLMLRDVRAAEAQAKMGDPYNAVVANNPQMLAAGAAAASNAFMITLGRDNMQTMVETLKALTGALNSLNAAVIAHPSLAKDIFGIAAALAALGIVASGLMTTLLPLMAARNIKNWLLSGGPVPGGPAAATGAAGALGGLGGNAAAAGAGAFGGLLGALGLAKMAQWGFETDRNEQTGLFNVKSYERFWRELQKDWKAGDWLGFHPFGGNPTEKKGGDLTVNLNVDGQKLTSHVIKGVVDTANGPQTGRGDFDNKRGYTQTEN